MQAMGMSFKGVAMVHSGDWRAGIKLIDEATAMAISEPGDLRAASDVYCHTIAVCRNLGDYRRAGEWTDRADRWMHAHSVGGYPGDLSGAPGRIETTARFLVGGRARCPQGLHRARAFSHHGRHRFRPVRDRGSAETDGGFQSAEEAFGRAYEFGHNAQPGLALLMLNRGSRRNAAKSIAAAMHWPDGAVPLPASSDTLSRGHLLPAQVEIALEIGDTETARRAVDELDGSPPTSRLRAGPQPL